MRAWLTLTLTTGIGPVLARRLITVTGSPQSAAEASVNELRHVEGIGAHRASAIHKALIEARNQVDDEIARVNARADTRVICPDDADYPYLLKSLNDAPLVLYVHGTTEPRDLNAIAIVGSRKCSFYGREQAERFGALLAGAGCTVVSGGARGVDSAAHRGAMSATNGRTIAVLGSGLDVPYPPENEGLFESIARRGCVMSEFPLGTPPAKENFPRRNRVVSGMSRGVLVIEADERSGALITARQAIEDHDRPVMAIPGRVDNPQSAGPHKLLREGAILVTRVEHVLEAVGALDASLPDLPLFDSPVNVLTQKATQVLSAVQQNIVDALSSEPSSIDALMDRTSLEAHVITRELTLLSLRGFARRIDGAGFVRGAQ